MGIVLRLPVPSDMNPRSEVSSSLLRPGTNCWRLAASRRLAVLIDGCRYFEALAEAMARARRRIAIVGWDFDARMRLRPDRDERPLATFLRELVDACPTLEIHVLVWRNSLFYGYNADFPNPFAGSWSDHPRIHYRLDDRHPVGSSHHQKIVCIDDALAFLGGIDLTQRRWDGATHAPDDPLRRTPDGEPHGPVHDVQVAVDGKAARCIAELVSERWQTAGGAPLEPLDPVLPGADGDPWPAGLAADLRGQGVALARTRPAYGELGEVREIEQLNRDALAAARRFIYLETQYFAAPDVAELLSAHLRREDGPEIVIVATHNSEGWIEHYVMAHNRDHLFARLRADDRHGRLRLLFPVADAGGTCEIKVHSKVMIVDDRFLRVGSSNFNQRSLGMDTECDLAFEATGKTARAAITRIGTRLLAEHLGVTPSRLAGAVRRGGSWTGAIDGLNGRGRHLVPFPDGEAPAALVPGSALLDPARPLDLGYLWESLIERS